jgi:hypothetical protein
MPKHLTEDAAQSINGALTLNSTSYTYGTGAAAAHRTALGLGAGDNVTFNTVTLSPIVGFAGFTAGSAPLGLRFTIASTASFAFRAGSLQALFSVPAAEIFEQRNGTAAQEFRVYGTYTSSSNYRRLALKMSTTGVAQIVAEGAGSGAAGNVLELPANTTFADSSATRTALGGGAAGQAVFQAATVAAANQALGDRYFFKASDESRSNTTTYTVDSELAGIPVLAGKRYRVEYQINAYVPNPEGGKARFVLPEPDGHFPITSGIRSSAQWGNGGAVPGSLNYQGGTQIFVASESAGYNQNRSTSGFFFTGMIKTSGNIELQWAQNTSGATATVLQSGSMIRVTELPS